MSSAAVSSFSGEHDGGNPQENSGRYPTRESSSQRSKQQQPSTPPKSILHHHSRHNSNASANAQLLAPPSIPPRTPPGLSGVSRNTTSASGAESSGCGSDEAVQHQEVLAPESSKQQQQQQPHENSLTGDGSNGSGSTNPQGASPLAACIDKKQQKRQSWDKLLFGTNTNQAVQKLSQAIDSACTANPCGRDDAIAVETSDDPYEHPRNSDNNNSKSDDQPMMSSLVHLACPPEATAAATGMQHSAAEWFAAAATATNQGMRTIMMQGGANDGDEGNSALERRLQRHDKRTVLSRTYEEIEVSPNHHIQVRLPPTNPVLAQGEATSSAAAAAAAAQPSSLLQQQQPPQQPLASQVAATTAAKISPAASARATKDGNSGGRPNNGNSTSAKSATPVTTLEVKPEEAAELERSISELTMRSSYAATDGALQKIPENRRMAYYAVGKHHRQSVRGGNRRCYFTGKLIFNNMPFYAGSVLQGLRTLVVFCLPSAIGLPERELVLKHQQTVGSGGPHERTSSFSTMGSSLASLKGLRLLSGGNRASLGGGSSKQSYHTTSSHNLVGGAGSVRDTPSLDHRASPLSRRNRKSSGASITNASSASKTSRLSSLDDLSLSIEGDLDPNWSLDRDFLLSVLPPASPSLLQQMATLYPDQFETLPVQVRDAKQWKLYIKFCFFSGLPISEGEMHYKVRDDIADAVYGEEIVLSHDVLEASTGTSSAEILTLPNRTVMRYLRKHYAQQCSKLDDRVFQRASWERVAPEV